MSEWRVDGSVNPKDAEGWGYSLGFDAATSTFSLGEWMAGDSPN